MPKSQETNISLMASSLLQLGFKCTPARHFRLVCLPKTAIESLLRTSIIEIAMIEVRSRDSIAVFGKQTRRKWRAGVHLNPNWSSELAIRDMFVSCDFGIVDDGLSAFFDVEDNVNFGFVVDGFGSDFYIFVSMIVIQGLEVLYA